MTFKTLKTGLDIHVKIWGDGPPALFIHPYLLDNTVWHLSLEKLARHRTCILVDLPGHGRSDPLRHTDLEPDRDADLLFELMDTLNVDGAFDIVGLAAGGIIGAIMAADRPDRVISLSLLSTIFHKPDLEGMAIAQSQLAGLTLRENRDMLFRQFDAYMTSPSASLDSRARYKSMLSTCRYETLVALFTSKALRGRPDLPAKITMPTLFPYGEDDASMQNDKRDALIGDIPNATFASVANGGRLLPLEAPDEMAEALVKFWAEQT